jgi:hypothetical protein
MVLEAFDSRVEESRIEAEARMEEEGTEIGELERLARLFGRFADIQEVPVERLPELLEAEKWAMTYIDRAVFDLSPEQRTRHTLRGAKIHVVIPTRISADSVYCNDPLLGREIRRSLRLFRRAYEPLGNRCVVCSKRPE